MDINPFDGRASLNTRPFFERGKHHKHCAGHLVLRLSSPVLGILSALYGDANRPTSKCAHDAPHSRTHPEGSMLGPGAVLEKKPGL